MSKGYHTFRLGEAEGMQVGALVTSVVTSLAIMTVLAGGAVPDSVPRMDLSAEMASMGEW